jgi:hypothetical protein
MLYDMSAASSTLSEKILPGIETTLGKMVSSQSENVSSGGVGG